MLQISRQDQQRLARAVVTLETIPMRIKVAAVHDLGSNELAMITGLAALNKGEKEFEIWLEGLIKDSRSKKIVGNIDAEEQKLKDTVVYLFQHGQLASAFKMQQILAIKVGTAVVLATAKQDGVPVVLKFVVDKTVAQNEIEKLVQLGGKHQIIPLKDHFLVSSSDLYCLVLPYYPGGQEPKSNAEIRSFMFQLLQALEYCHKKDIIHRDVNPSNVLFKRGEHLEVVLADFGLAMDYKTGKLARAGTLPYMAPEMLAGWGDSYAYGVDIWGAGVIFAELLLQRPLFSPEDMADMDDKVSAFLKNSYAWKDFTCSRDELEVLQSMLTKEQNRKTATQLLKMKYFEQCK